MKIAFLNIYGGKVDRGLETFVFEVAERLSKSDSVVLFQSGRIKNEVYEVREIKVYSDFTMKESSGTFLRKFFLDYWSLRILLFTIKTIPSLWKERFDVIVPTNGGWQTVLCRLLTWIKGEKMVISGQAGPGYDDRWNLLWRPNIFIALTDDTKKWAQKNGFGVKVETIPNGVDLKKFNKEIKPINTPLKKPVVLCVGALTPFKRIDLTIKAVSKIKDVSLLVVGDGELKEELTELGNKLLGGRFFITKSSYKDMPSFYRAADVFSLASSRAEAFGIVYAEAMACNLPVVATDTPARREIIGDAGLFVNPEDIDEYAAVLNKALKSDWGNKPREQAQKFSWDRVAARYSEVIKECLKI